MKTHVFEGRTYHAAAPGPELPRIPAKPPKAGGANEASLRGFQGNVAPVTSSSQASDLQNSETTLFCLFKSPVCGTVLQRRWEIYDLTYYQ